MFVPRVLSLSVRYLIRFWSYRATGAMRLDACKTIHLNRFSFFSLFISFDYKSVQYNIDLFVVQSTVYFNGRKYPVWLIFPNDGFVLVSGRAISFVSKWNFLSINHERKICSIPLPERIDKHAFRRRELNNGGRGFYVDKNCVLFMVNPLNQHCKIPDDCFLFIVKVY